MFSRAREKGVRNNKGRFEPNFSLLKNSSRVSRPILFSWFHNHGLNVCLFETQESRPDDDRFSPRRVPIVILSPKQKFRADFSIAAYAGWKSLMAERCINALYIAPAIPLLRSNECLRAVAEIEQPERNFFLLSSFVSDPFFPLEQKQRGI